MALKLIHGAATAMKTHIASLSDTLCFEAFWILEKETPWTPTRPSPRVQHTTSTWSIANGKSETYLAKQYLSNVRPVATLLMPA